MLVARCISTKTALLPPTENAFKSTLFVHVSYISVGFESAVSVVSRRRLPFVQQNERNTHNHEICALPGPGPELDCSLTRSHLESDSE